MSRKFSNNAAPTTLAAPVGIGDATITLDSVAGLPAEFPFTLILDPDGLNMEIVTVTGLAGTVCAVTRGEDNTTAVAHDADVTVIHGHSGRDFSEALNHADETTGVHGVGSGVVVGTNATQNLSNKTLVASAAGNVPLVVLADPLQTADLVQLKNSALDIIARFSKQGYLTTGKANVTLTDSGAIGFTVKGFTGQTADLIRATDSSDNVLMSVDAAGNLIAQDATVVDLTVSGTLSISDLTAADDLTVTDDASVGGDLTVTGATVVQGIGATAVTATNVYSTQTTGSSGRTVKPYAHVALSGATQNISTSTSTQVAYNANTASSDVGFADHSNDRLVVPAVAGLYLLTAQVTLDEKTDGLFQIRVDGAQVAAGEFQGFGGGSQANLAVPVVLAGGEIITAFVTHNAGHTVQTTTIGAGTYLKAVLLP